MGAVFCAGCSGGAFGVGSDAGGHSSAGGIAGSSDSRAGSSASNDGGSSNGGKASIAGASSGGAPTAGNAGQAGDTSVPPVTECPCAAPNPTCEDAKCTVRGPSLIKAGGSYVDSTEVTVSEYDAFLRAKSDPSAQTEECSWNDSFEPSVVGAGPNRPVVGVDFCDAAAFCAWADKRLCGKVGGGALQLQDLNDAAKSEWVKACGGPKAQPFPYGTSHQAGACNDSSGSGHVEDVGSFKECSGFYTGVHDLVGNVAEWVNACDATKGATDGCETIGGSFADDNGCTGSSLKHRDEQLPNVGFRCCSQ